MNRTTQWGLSVFAALLLAGPARADVVTLSPPVAHAPDLGQVAVSLELDSSGDRAGMQCRLQFPAGAVIVDSVTVAGRAAGIAAPDFEAGTDRLDVLFLDTAGSGVVPAGSGPVLTLHLRPSGAVGDTIDLDFGGLLIADGAYQAIPSSSQGAQIVVSEILAVPTGIQPLLAQTEDGWVLITFVTPEPVRFHVSRREGTTGSFTRLTGEPAPGNGEVAFLDDDPRVADGGRFEYLLEFETPGGIFPAGPFGIATEPGRLPKAFALHATSPNPMRSRTAISYDLPRSTQVSLRVYDLSGRLVRTLIDAREEAGTRTVSWDARDDQGRPVSTGIFFYQLRADSFVETRKIVVLQ